MNGLLLVLWFVCGIAGCHVGAAYDKANGNVPNSGDVWAVILGPFALLGAAIVCIAKAVKPKGAL